MTTINKYKHSFTIIGIGNQPTPQWNDNVLGLFKNQTYFSGGKRHYEIVKPFLPQNHQWIPIAGKMENIIAQYKSINFPIIIFASGDPFFYGFGNTLKRLLPESKLDVYPYFSSIQRLCHKTQTNYGSIKTVTLHGRPWSELDEALINQEPLIGVLTDQKHTPSEIAKRLLAYNYTNYKIIIGEELDGEEEKITNFSLEQAVDYTAKKLNCVVLKQVQHQTKPLGFPDHEFETLEGRPGMITKLPIRLISLQALGLEKVKTFWDIGSCTGAVTIEAKLNFPHLHCIAFEKRAVCNAIINNNARKFQTPGIQIEIGDFFEQNSEAFQKPQAVFIGGHGNRLEELIAIIDQKLEKNGTVVMNTVLEKSYTIFQKAFKKRNYKLNKPLKITVDEYNTVHVLVAKKEA